MPRGLPVLLEEGSDGYQWAPGLSTFYRHLMTSAGGPGLFLPSARLDPCVSQAADVGETLELLRKVVLVQHGVCSVLHHLERHRPKDRSELVDALRPG